jgi:protein-S-isoprenylcysteine O-methyltransferase Ste14
MKPTGFFIDLHKALVIPVTAAAMVMFGNFSTVMWLYLGMHGTYSILWLIKGRTYPDRRFAEQVPIWIGGLFVFLPLAGYYAAPILLAWLHPNVPGWAVTLGVSSFTFGIFLHYVADAQKYFTLQVHPGLIETGLFARTRNPNYLGEIMTYMGYAIISWNWFPFVVNFAWIFGFFVRNMIKKDRSMSRHPGFAAYKARTGLLFPRILPVRALGTDRAPTET